MRPIVFALVLATSTSVVGAAAAHGGAGGAQLPSDAEPVTPEAKKALEVLAALPKDEATTKLVAEPTKKAKEAVARAHGAHLAKDEEGARLLGKVALAWAESAAAWVRAAEAEKKAAEGEGRHKDLKDKIERAKALVAETEARKLQLLSEVAKAEEEAKKAPPKPDAKKPKDPKAPKEPKPKEPKAPKKAEEPKKPAPKGDAPKGKKP